MTIWQGLTKTLPLNDEHDVLARIGFRFVWCTGPYFLVAYALSAFGDRTMLLHPASFFVLALPLAGGLLDWCRLRWRGSGVGTHR